MSTYAAGLDALGARASRQRAWDVIGSSDLLGYYDLQVIRHNLDTLKPVNVDIARTLVRSGMDVIAQAITGAKQPWYKSDLPGDTARKNTQAHLQWHAQNLFNFSDAMAYYTNEADLRKWVAQAYIEANAVEAGAAYIDAAWNAMWNEIQQKLAAIPKATVKALTTAASGIVEGVTGVPVWAWAVGGVAVAGIVGFVAWKLHSWRGAR